MGLPNLRDLRGYVKFQRCKDQINQLALGGGNSHIFLSFFLPRSLEKMISNLTIITCFSDGLVLKPPILPKTSFVVDIHLGSTQDAIVANEGLGSVNPCINPGGDD